MIPRSILAGDAHAVFNPLIKFVAELVDFGGETLRGHR